MSVIKSLGNAIEILSDLYYFLVELVYAFLYLIFFR